MYKILEDVVNEYNRLKGKNAFKKGKEESLTTLPSGVLSEP